MSNSMLSIPPTDAISDPQVRTVLDALAQNLGVVRNEYVNTGNVDGYAQAAFVKLLSGSSDIDTALNNIHASILSSALYQKLTEPFSIALDNSKVLTELENRIAAAIGAQQQYAKQLLDETANRAAAISTEVTNRTNAIQTEANTRAQALLDEVAARGNAIGNLQTQINTLAASSSGDLSQVIAAVQQEQTARTNAISAEASSRETLATQIRGSYTGTDINALSTGLIYTERVSRVTADSALQTSISALSSTVTTNNNTLTAAITQEASTRADAVSAEAALRVALTARVGTAESNITGLQSTTSSQATSLSSLTTRMGSAESNISSLQTTTASQATSINSLYTRMGSAESSITSLNSTTASQANSLTSLTSRIGTAESNITSLFSTTSSQASSLSSLTTRIGTAESNISYLTTTSYGQASSISSLTSRMGSAESAISNETIARTNADGSLTSSINGLAARMGSAEAAITSEQSTRTNKDVSLASALNNIWAKLNGSGSAIDDGSLAAVSPSAAVANRWNGVIAAVTDPNTGQINSTSIKQELNSYANNANGTFNSSYTLRINNNGYISGFGLMSTSGAGGAPGNSSDFIVLADRFAVVGTGVSPATPFTVLTSYDGYGNPPGAYITNAVIQNAAIGTLKIANQAVTLPQSAYTGALLDGYGMFVVQTLDIISTGAPALIVFGSHAYSSQHENLYMKLRRDGVEIFSVGGGAYNTQIQGQNMELATLIDTPGEGSHRYELVVGNPYGYYASSSARCISYIEVKR